MKHPEQEESSAHKNISIKLLLLLRLVVACKTIPFASDDCTRVYSCLLSATINMLYENMAHSGNYRKCQPHQPFYRTPIGYEALFELCLSF